MGTRNTVDDAYNFAKGKAIKKSTTGEMVQKSTPYDWCAVTDHAEYFGMMPLILEKGNPARRTPRSASSSSGDPRKGAEAFQLIMDSVSRPDEPLPYHLRSEGAAASTVWEKHKSITTNKHNEPGKFTTLIAFEWTSQAMYSQNLHHNVFFRDDKGPEMRLLVPRFDPSGRICGPTRKSSARWGTRTSRSRTTPMSATV